jgi:hypothetical protein
MTDIHSCSLYCERPECVKAQRDELRDKLVRENALAQPEPVQDTEAHYKAVVEGVQKLFNDKRTQPAPVQEPVAWMDVDEKGAMSGLRYWSEPDNRHEVALYTTPPQRTWVGLTEEELYEIYDESDDGSSPCGVCGACAKCKIEVAIARAIEAKLRSKNG